MNIFNPMLSDDDELFGSNEDELDSLPDFDEEDLEKFIESSDGAEKRDLVPGSIDDSYPVNYDDYVQQDIERGVREPEDADRTYEESFRSVLEDAGYEPDDFSSGSSVDVVDDDTVDEGVSSVGEVFDEEVEEYSPSTSLEELLALQEAAEEDDESVDGDFDEDGGDYPLSGSMFYISDDDEDGGNSHQLDIDAIITKAIDMGASDIDVIPNDEVTFTILGEVMRIPQFGVITNRQVANSYRDITSSQAQDDFLRFPEMDTSYEVRRGKHQGRRLRLSVGKTFDNHFMVFRVISNHIPSPQEIGMDARLLRWSTLPNGLVMVNGKTGAGKALHVDTDIPTPSGMKKVRDIGVGDELFDENGGVTKVIDIHRSEDTKHYAVKFRNGEVVKTAGNHLWEVECLNDRVLHGPWVRELLSVEDFKKAVSMLADLKESSETVLMGTKDISQIFANSSAEIFEYLNNNFYETYVNGEQYDGFEVVSSLVVESERRFNNIESWKLADQTKCVLRMILTTDEMFAVNVGDKDGNLYWAVPYSVEPLGTNVEDKSLQQSIRHRRHYIEEIVEIEDTPEDYVCFEVDSPTHMFLCSASYIPTHNSTTLASIIREIQLNRSDKIITVEKPVEYVYGIAGRSSVTQREVGRDTKSFAAALDSAMRQHPDVLLIGEVRNQEEVSALLYAAETGHLAFSTMHTNSAPHTLNRIKRLFSGEEQVRILGDLSEVARGFSNQLLVKSLDGKSRSSVNEVLEVDDTVKNLILTGDVRGIVSYQEEQGITMEHELVKAVIEGRCSVEEARKVSSFRPRLDKLLEENDLV